MAGRAILLDSLPAATAAAHATVFVTRAGEATASGVEAMLVSVDEVGTWAE